MKIPRDLIAILTTLLCASSLSAWAEPGYRLIPLDDGTHGTTVSDLNRRGEVVGMTSVDNHEHAYRWRAGVFTDLNDSVDPNSTYTRASAINDFSTIVGNEAENFFEGFLWRDGQVSPIDVNGEANVYPIDINNRDQIIVETVNGSYLLEGANVRPLERLPGVAEPTHAVAINERGVIAGNTFTSAGSRAVLWQDGTVMDLGVVAGASSSFAYALNDRNQVVGNVNINGSSHAMRWSNGMMTLLPRLTPDEESSSPSDINNWGVIVGVTEMFLPEFTMTATLWLGDHVVELDSLVRADDPLKPFVHLVTAQEINDRGDIAAMGVDSRTNGHMMYFMTLFDH